MTVTYTGGTPVVRTTCPACAANVPPEKPRVTSRGFDYVDCPMCGTRAIDRVPNDLARYYGAQYYTQSRSLPRRLLQRLKARVHAHTPLGIHPEWPGYQGDLASVLRFAPDRNVSILDVGCGNGRLLAQLRHIGYRNLTGVDPYLADGLSASGVRLIRGRPEDVPGVFDLVMLQHAIEHDSSPVDLLKRCAAKLSAHGRLVVRTPVVDSWAADHYGPSWVQQDAPRHLVLLSRDGLRRAVGRAGLQVLTMYDDATTRMTGRGRAFVRQLNASGRGDQVCALLGPA